MSAPQYPDLAPGVTRVTQSSAETYLRCGVRYVLERESRHRHATVRMLIGSGVAAAAHADNAQKLEVGEGLPLEDLVERAVDGYEQDREASEVPDSSVEQIAGVDATANAARVYGLHVSPIVHDVVAAEVPIVAQVDDGLELAGTPDVITDEGIGDLKVGRVWDDEDAHRSRQLGIYGILHLARTGAFPARAWIDNIHRLPKGQWGHRRIWTRRRREDYEAVLGIVQRVRRGIEAGVFLPAPEGSYWCSPTWCPFWAKCPAIQGGSSV